MRSARSTDEKERQQGQGGTPKAHRRSRTRGGPQYAAVLCLGCAHRYPAHWTGERLCCPIAPGMPQLSLRQCPKLGHLLVALLPPIMGLPLSSTKLRGFVAGIEQPENIHWHMSTTMLRCPYSIWDSCGCIYSNIHRWRVGWSPRRPNNKSDHYNVPAHV